MWTLNWLWIQQKAYLCLAKSNPHELPNPLACLKSGTGPRGEFLSLSMLLPPVQSMPMRSAPHSVEAAQFRLVRLLLVTSRGVGEMLPGDFQTKPFSFKALNVSVSLPGNTLTTQLNQTNLIHILYMTFVLEKTCCPAFQSSRGVMPSSLFIRSMPKSQSWLMCSLSTCFPSLKENVEWSIQSQFQAQLLSARQVSNVLADSVIDDCMPFQALVETQWYSCNSWAVSSPDRSIKFGLWSFRSQNDCIFYPSCAKMFGHWAYSSDLRPSGGIPELFWFILTFQSYKWNKNLIIFSYWYDPY